MSKAFKCDKCGKFHEGIPEQQVGHNEGLERLIHLMLEVKFSPEQPEAQFYVKDLCLSCAKIYCELWKLTTEQLSKIKEILK